MYGYLIPKGIECQQVFFDGTTTTYNNAEHGISPLNTVMAITKDYVEVQIGDSIITMYVNVRDLTVVDMTDTEKMHTLLTKE